MSAPQTSRRLVAVVFDSDDFGGAEAAMADQIRPLGEQFDFVAILSERADPRTRETLAEAGCRLETVRGLRRRCMPPAYRQLKARLSSLAPALVHISLSDQGAGLAPILACRSLGLTSVATLHLVSPGRQRAREALTGRLLRTPDAVIAVSAFVADYLGRLGVPAQVIYNGVAEPAAITGGRAALGLDPAGLVVGGLGRLDHQKGWDILCEAAELVLRNVPEVQFIVLGDGPDMSLLKDGGRGTVRFAGYRADAAAMVGAFDVLVVPSRWEGFGRVAAEAMMMGIPVIAAETGGLPEVVGEWGLLVPPADPAALAVAIERLARDPELRSRLGAGGRERASERFSLTRQVDEIKALYGLLLERPHGDIRRETGARSM